MPNYANGKIYAIRSYLTDKIYIGSTCQQLSNRLSKHRTNYRSHLNGKYHFVTSFFIIEHEDAYIELLELYPCNSKMELERREGELIRLHNCVNRCIAGRTSQQYRDDNIEKIKEYNKNYKIENAEKIKEYKSTKIECNICQKLITQNNILAHKKRVHKINNNAIETT